MDINSIFVVTAAVVFAGMLWFFRFNPQGFTWMRFGFFEISVIRDTAHKMGLFALALVAVRGFLDKSISPAATTILFIAGALSCAYAAYRPREDK